MAVPPTVFLVDDDPGARDSMRYLLESDGLAVRAFSSAREFLDAYDPGRPGCLVLDVRMPELDGLELQQKLGARGDHLPIIFVTGYGNVPTCARAMKAGAIDFLEKPVDHDTLLSLVYKGLDQDVARHEQKRQRQEVDRRIASLTEREREVMQFLYQGKSLKQIAVRLGISVQTAAKHRIKVLRKLNVDGETELVRLLMVRSLQ